MLRVCRATGGSPANLLQDVEIGWDAGTGSMGARSTAPRPIGGAGSAMLSKYGAWAVLVVFTETGLPVLGVFLPGGTLLLPAGLACSPAALGERVARRFSPGHHWAGMTLTAPGLRPSRENGEPRRSAGPRSVRGLNRPLRPLLRPPIAASRPVSPATDGPGDGATRCDPADGSPADLASTTCSKLGRQSLSLHLDVTGASTGRGADRRRGPLRVAGCSHGRTSIHDRARHRTARL